MCVCSAPRQVLVTDIPAIAGDTATRVAGVKQARKNPSSKKMITGSVRKSDSGRWGQHHTAGAEWGTVKLSAQLVVANRGRNEGRSC